MPHAPFFLTRPDLEALLRTVEASAALTYVRMGAFPPNTTIEHHVSGREIPQLGEATGNGSIKCAAYLVVERGTEICVYTRNDHVFVDQRENPDSITFTPAGIHASGVIIHGRVATVNDSATAKRLMNTFRSALRRHSKRIRAFYVGPDAERRWRAGARLTVGVDASRELDLAPG